ncbi:sodium:calcium antiporter [Candidatus Roizmanbacteria bacterium]|nr:sodium:calcium antiporter [Candidatus Roizmanbacteria bacterium]
MVTQIFFYIFAFLLIWIAAGVIVTSVDRLAHKLNLSSFAISFFLLGILTSVPEISVGINSLIDKKPEIFVGNLIGGVVVIFLLVIPLLAVFGGGVRLTHQMGRDKLLFALVVIVAPSVFTLDGRISFTEGLFMIFHYAFLVFVIEKRKGLLEQIKDKFIQNKDHIANDFIKILAGVIVVFVASKYVVDTTIYFSNFFHISSFLISLIVVSIGTNLPELSLVVRSLMMRKKEVAFGDYLGSAAANTLIFGAMVLLNKGDVVVPNNFLQTFIFITGGLLLFYIFSRSKNDISREEGLVLLLGYVMFLIFEVI